MRLITTLIIILTHIMYGCSLNPNADMCGNNISKEITSPDKKLKAIIFTRDCGATTGISSQLSIIDYSDQLENEKGNTLIISDKEYDPESETGALNVNAEWSGNNDLIIYFNLMAETFEKKNNIKGVKITYRELVE